MRAPVPCNASPYAAAVHSGARSATSTGPFRAFVRVALATALAVVAGWATSAVPGTIEVTSERHGDGIRIHAQALLKADAAAAWRVLTDYGSYAAFIPDLRVSRVVAREGSIVTVEQSGSARLWLLSAPLDVTFEITESPPWDLRSRAVAGSLRALRSHYRLVPESTGVRLDYVGDVTPGALLIEPVEEYAVRVNIARQFQALVDEIERRGAPGR